MIKHKQDRPSSGQEVRGKGLLIGVEVKPEADGARRRVKHDVSLKKKSGE